MPHPERAEALMTGPTKPFRLDGSELAGYRIESLIGRGGMAYVYRALDQRLGRTVALKVLAPELATDQEFRQRFLRESRLAASIDHPNVIPIYDAGESDGMLYIAMRYVEGSDLKALLIREQQLDIDRALDIFSQVAEALDAAHAHGLVHRDVKPANILIARGTMPQGHEHVYLSDFGVTKRATSKSGVTAVGVIVGTMDYLAPEQIGGKAVSARTDIYALGCVVYQALTGSVPFVRDDDAALLWAHLVETLPHVLHLRPDVPPAAQDVLLKATAKDPEDRYSSCSEFLAELTLRLHEQRSPGAEDTAGRYVPPDVAAGPASGRRTGPPAPGAHGAVMAGGGIAALTAGRRRPPRRWIWAALGGFVAAALVLAGFLVLRPHSPSTIHFAGNDVVPVSFNYPADWQKMEQGNTAMFSPHAAAFLNLFTQGGAPETWSEIGRLLRDDRGGAVGMYTFFNQVDYSSADLRQTLQTNLPEQAELNFPQPGARLGTAGATLITGELSDPANSASQLQFACYIGQVPTQSRNVHMIFVSDAGSFEQHRATFDSIVKSARLSG
jgi:hypothetical protein